MENLRKKKWYSVFGTANARENELKFIVKLSRKGAKNLPTGRQALRKKMKKWDEKIKFAMKKIINDFFALRS